MKQALVKTLTCVAVAALCGTPQAVLAQEGTRLNKLIEHIEDELLLATPIDLASSDAGVVPTGVVNDERWPKERVWVSATAWESAMA